MPRAASATRIAAALVCFTFGAYLLLARKVRCPGPACSIPATPVISRSPSPSRRHPKASAISRSLIGPNRAALSGYRMEHGSTALSLLVVHDGELLIHSRRRTCLRQRLAVGRGNQCGLIHVLAVFLPSEGDTVRPLLAHDTRPSGRPYRSLRGMLLAVKLDVANSVFVAH